ncbi:MAG: hypothetical protein AB1640_06090 [bacterium]
MRKSSLILLTLTLLACAAGPAQAAIVDPYGFWIDHVYPSTVGNTGPATLHMVGAFPGDTCRVTLRFPYQEEDISGTVLERNVGIYTSSGGDPLDELVVRFDMTGALHVSYDIEVVPEIEGMECGSGPIAYGFGLLTVEPVRKADLWVEIIGQTAVRVDSMTSHFVWYGNQGNVDMDAAILFVAIPASVASYALGFDRAQYALPVNPNLPPPLNTPPTEYANVSFGGSTYTVIPLYVRDIAPGAAKMLRIDLQWGGAQSKDVFRAWWSGSSASDSQPIW